MGLHKGGFIQCESRLLPYAVKMNYRKQALETNLEN